MTRLLLFVAGAFVLSALGRSAELVPASRTAIFPAEKAADLIRTVCYAPPDAAGYWTPTQKDLEGAEQKLGAYLKSRHAEGKKDWTTFRKQVAGVRREDDALIFIYYFHFNREIEEDLVRRKTPGYDPNAWRREPYVVNDGGDSYFRVLYDPKKKQFVWFEQNGEA